MGQLNCCTKKSPTSEPEENKEFNASNPVTSASKKGKKRE
jgi:hypothetical protein